MFIYLAPPNLYLRSLNEIEEFFLFWTSKSCSIEKLKICNLHNMPWTNKKFSDGSFLLCFSYFFFSFWRHFQTSVKLDDLVKLKISMFDNNLCNARNQMFIKIIFDQWWSKMEISKIFQPLNVAILIKFAFSILKNFFTSGIYKFSILFHHLCFSDSSIHAHYYLQFSTAIVSLGFYWETFQNRNDIFLSFLCEDYSFHVIFICNVFVFRLPIKFLLSFQSLWS